MTYEISENKLAYLLEKATEAGARKVLTELGLKKSQVSQREAFRRFGEARIMRWRKEGMIKPIKSVGKIYYNLNDLERLKGINELYDGTIETENQ
jgi:hypothetical protein